MAVTLIRHVGASPRALWEAVTDFVAHAEAVPLTTIHPEPGRPAPGWRFTARTALGPVGFDDPMRLTTWEPPGSDPDEPDSGFFELVKEGRLLGGWASVRVGPGTSERTSRLEWREEIWLAPLPALTRPRPLRRLADLATARLFDRAIDRFSAAARAR